MGCTRLAAAGMRRRGRLRVVVLVGPVRQLAAEGTVFWFSYDLRREMGVRGKTVRRNGNPTEKKKNQKKPKVQQDTQTHR